MRPRRPDSGPLAMKPAFARFRPASKRACARSSRWRDPNDLDQPATDDAPSLDGETAPEGECGRRKARGEFRNASRMHFLLTRLPRVLARIMQKHHAHDIGTGIAAAASRSLGWLSVAVWHRCHTRWWTGRARQPVVNAQPAIEYILLQPVLGRSMCQRTRVLTLPNLMVANDAPRDSCFRPILA